MTDRQTDPDRHRQTQTQGHSEYPGYYSTGSQRPHRCCPLAKTYPFNGLFTSYRSMSAADAGAQQQTRRPHVSQPPLLSMEETDRRTDGHATVTLTLFRILHGTGSRNQEIIGFWDGSGFDRTIFKQAAPRSGQNNHANITSRNLYRLDAIPDAQPTVSKH